MTNVPDTTSPSQSFWVPVLVARHRAAFLTSHERRDGGVYQPRISASTTSVSTAETRIEPRQPRRFEKKKNMRVEVPEAPQGSLSAARKSKAASREVLRPTARKALRVHRSPGTERHLSEVARVRASPERRFDQAVNLADRHQPAI